MVRTTTIRIKETTKELMDSIPMRKSTYDDIINRTVKYWVEHNVDKVSVKTGSKNYRPQYIEYGRHGSAFGAGNPEYIHEGLD